MTTSWQRIKTALEHKEPDRVPIGYYATPEANAALKQHLGLRDDEALLQRLGVDYRRVGPRYVGPAHKSGDFFSAAVEEDIWGVKRRPVHNEFGGMYMEISHYPLAHVREVRELDDHQWPELEWFDCSGIEAQIDKLNSDGNRKWFMTFGGGGFESPWYMRGMEQFLMDLVVNPEIAEAICQRVTDFFLARTRKLLDAAKGKIDMVLTGGDIGTQRGMLLSPKLWRERVKPWSGRLIQTYKKLGCKTIYHSDGAFVEVIEDFIELGLDVLNPIQTRADGMDPAFLKKKFGDRLCFNGGVDIQEILPHGTPAEVAAETKRMIAILGAGGGYIVEPAHAFQPDTSCQNIMAMYEAALTHRYVPPA